MQIKNLFAKDINRSINGVIKVAQDDTASIKQELSEYVITNELQRHFANFFESYDRALDVPTDKIGVWISGFFGSGKSHFLKMLSYLLANKTVDGTPAIDYFDGKVADPMVYSRMRRAAEVPTETILFNIDSKGGQWKGGDEAKTALLRTFARVFYDHLGFYGEDLHLARMEQYVEEQGKTHEFREAFARINGGDWLADRDNYRIFEDDVVEAMQEVLGMSEASARNWFENTQDSTISPEKLTEEIAQYAEKRAQEHGGNFRLLFMVDEVGQFIGSDVNLMLNLQTLVENLGATCQGRVWVMVTSQEAIDEITKVAGNDFSKIQGRFNTRLSLSSSSVDEVIKRRVLEKTDAARAVLEDEYDQQSAVLKNLFTFESSQGDLKGYAGQTDFVETYPFVDYQFKIMPNVLAEIRKHGNSGKHLSGGERSMLSGFQEAAQKIQEENNTALVPLWRFYDTISTFLEHGIRQVIVRCAEAAEKNEGLMPQDLQVLKTLYLIHYIKDIKPTANNVAILMVDDMNVDKVVLRETVKGSLDRLVNENYVSRNGDAYHFLTDEEQDVAREIANTQIDMAAISENIQKAIFDEIYTSRKYHKGANDFPFDAYVDDALHGIAQNGMKLNVITVSHDLSDADEATLTLKSTEQALVVLPANDSSYFDLLRNVARIKRYVSTKNVQALPESTRRIITDKQNEANRNKKEATAALQDALANARIAVNGRMVRVQGGHTAKAVLDTALDELVSSVFTKADYVTEPVQGKADIVAILSGTAQAGLDGLGGANERAIQEVETYLENQHRLHIDTKMGDIQRKFQAQPFGWREADIAAVVASLLVQGKAQARDRGRTLNMQESADRKIIADRLTGKNADSLVIAKRQLPSASLINKTRSLLREMPEVSSVPEDIDDLTSLVIDVMEEQFDWCKTKLETEYQHYAYPDKKLVEDGMVMAKEILASRMDETALLKAFTDAEDQLLDWIEDAEAIRGFFPNQARLFSEAAKLQTDMADEVVYLVDMQQAQEALAQIAEILQDPKPYKRIAELPTLGSAVRQAHDEVVCVGRENLLNRMDLILTEIKDYAAPVELPAGLMSTIEQELIGRKSNVHSAKTRASLDAQTTQLDNWRKAKLAAINRAAEENKPKLQEAPTPDAQPALKAPKSKTIERIDLCRATRITSEADIDAYLATIREKLTAALAENDSVSIL